MVIFTPRFSGDRIPSTKLNQQLEFRGMRSHSISLYLYPLAWSDRLNQPSIKQRHFLGNIKLPQLKTVNILATNQPSVSYGHKEQYFTTKH